MTDFEPSTEPSAFDPDEAPDQGEEVVPPIDEDQSEGPKTDLTTDPEVIAEDEAESAIEPATSPHGEAAELADEWVFDRWVEHHEIDARLLAIPAEDLNPAAAKERHPQQGIRP